MNTLTNLIKYNKAIYCIYYYVFSFFIRFLGIFIKVDKNLILFNSYGGRKYDDSSKEIFLKMIKDKRFKHCRFIWGLHNPDMFDIPRAKKICDNSINYFYYALRAGCWVTNSSIERGLSFKKDKTFYINTWHGTPIKLMGIDIKDNNNSFRSKAKNNIDYMNVQSEYEVDLFSKAFEISKNNFLKVGLPRNDYLASYSIKDADLIKARLNIPKDKKVILYAPTFREFSQDETCGCSLYPPINLDHWKKELSNDYFIIFRAHYEVAKMIDIKNSDFIMDATSYPDLNELMIVSDLLISDYSSIYFDYSIMDKPMFHFCYDYDLYDKLRGMYFDIRDYISGADNEKDLLYILNNCIYDKEIKNTIHFKDKFLNYYGNATKKTVDVIYNIVCN